MAGRKRKMIVAVEIVIVVGITVFGWFALAHPEPCPKEYHTKGGDIVKYCNFDPESGWTLKK